MTKKRTLTIDELLRILLSETTETNINTAFYATKYNKSLSASKPDEKLIDEIRKKTLRVGKFSLKTRILKNEWVGHRPSSKAISWLYNEVFKNPKIFRYNKKLLFQGGLFMFEYMNPKYKDTSILPYFDKYPLVLAIDGVATSNGLRNRGFNLHLLPPRIRIITLCFIFEIYKNIYRYSVFNKYDNIPIPVKYKEVMKVLEPYGVGFAIRMYIPSRQRQIVRFPIREWYRAIFIPSRGYYDIRAKKLIREWKNYCTTNNISISEKIDWKSVIK